MRKTKYSASFPDGQQNGISDEDGWVRLNLSKNVCFEYLKMEWGKGPKGEWLYTKEILVDCGSGDEGQQACAKLHNLGYHKDSFTLEEGVWAFQDDYNISESGLDENGNLLPLTKKKLWDIYNNGCDARP